MSRGGSRPFALQLLVAALVMLGGAGTLLSAGRTLLPGARSPLLGFSLWSSVVLLALGGVVLLAVAAAELLGARRRRKAVGRVRRPDGSPGTGRPSPPGATQPS